MPNPQPTAAERFASFLLHVIQGVAARSGAGLPFPLIGLIGNRIRLIKQSIARLAALVRDGKYAPRRSGPRRKPADPKPRQESPLPSKFGWLLPLVPDAVVWRSQLEHLFRDPEVVALLAAAPAPLGRPIRSLCWMLLLRPPDILAPPRRPRRPAKPRPPREPKPAPLPPIGPPPTPPDAPEWMRMPPSRTRWLPSRTRAPKNRA
jgi:hypothetical protein